MPPSFMRGHSCNRTFNMSDLIRGSHDRVLSRVRDKFLTMALQEFTLAVWNWILRWVSRISCSFAQSNGQALCAAPESTMTLSTCKTALKAKILIPSQCPTSTPCRFSRVSERTTSCNTCEKRSPFELKQIAVFVTGFHLTQAPLLTQEFLRGRWHMLNVHRNQIACGSTASCCTSPNW